MIATDREGEEGEKVNLKICLAGELNPGLQCERRMIFTLGKSTDRYTKEDC